MMNQVSSIVGALCEHGEVVKVVCDQDGWTVEHREHVYHACDGRYVHAFLNGLAVHYLKQVA